MTVLSVEVERVKPFYTTTKQNIKGKLLGRLRDRLRGNMGRARQGICLLEAQVCVCMCVCVCVCERVRERARNKERDPFMR